MQSEKEDYDEWSDQELADALVDVEKDIQQCQKTLAAYRKNLNRSMENKEDLLDVIKQRAKKRRWEK